MKHGSCLWLSRFTCQIECVVCFPIRASPAYWRFSKPSCAPKTSRPLFAATSFKMAAIITAARTERPERISISSTTVPAPASAPTAVPLSPNSSRVGNARSLILSVTASSSKYHQNLALTKGVPDALLLPNMEAEFLRHQQIATYLQNTKLMIDEWARAAFGDTGCRKGGTFRLRCRRIY